MLTRYSVGGRGAVPGANGEPHAVLWNASTTKTIYLIEFVAAHYGATTATRPALVRCSTRGTPGSTVTPDIDNDRDGSVTPASAVVLDLAVYTVNPTYEPPRLMTWTITSDGGEIALVFRTPIAIPQSTGIAVEVVANLFGLDTTWTWEE